MDGCFVVWWVFVDFVVGGDCFGVGFVVGVVILVVLGLW